MASDNRCGYTWPADHDVGDSPNRQHCCFRETLDDRDRCVWHADATDRKTVDALREARVDPAVRRQTSPVGELLDGAVLSGLELGDALSLRRVSLRDGEFTGAAFAGGEFTEADLTGAVLFQTDFTDAELRHGTLRDAAFYQADLTGANFTRADLAGANFRQSDLTEATLRHSDLTAASFKRADLSGSSLFEADLTDSNFFSADLTGADMSGTVLPSAAFEDATVTGVNLRDAELTGADLREARLADLSVNANTNCTKLHEGETVGNDSLSTTLLGRNSRFDPPDWDAVARAYHELKTTFSASGLVGKAREMHVRERRARSLEVKATEGLVNRRYLRSLPSRFVTGYGVRPGTLFSWMVALFVVSTAVYAVYGVGDGALETLAYSTLALTAVPPGPGLPAQPVPLLVVAVETFLGTLSTVLLGYMLGSRERF